MNGGSFPLPVKDILGRIYSKLRNPTIAKLFRFVGIAENAGYGMKKLVSWERLTGTRPTIESERTIAVVSFPLKSAIKRKTDDNEGRHGAKSGAKSGAKVSPRQEAILALMINNSEITLDEIAKEIGVGTSTIDREIAKMTHLVKRVGSKKGGHWEILND